MNWICDCGQGAEDGAPNGGGTDSVNHLTAGHQLGDWSVTLAIGGYSVDDSFVALRVLSDAAMP